ncbi:hypothetical protein ACVOMS_31165 [Bradyrhizobium guangxiense]
MLNAPEEKSFEEVQELGAVITQPTPNQRHVGFLYKLGNEPARMLHLAWQNRLVEEAPTEGYFWVQSGLDETTRKVIAPVVAEVFSSQELPVPYSPIFQGLYFDAATLRYDRHEPGEGLTCATFIVAVLDALGRPLFDVDEWTARDADFQWHDQIIDMLERSPDATQEHIDAMRSRPRGARFRPEEVVGSIWASSPPISFTAARVLGLCVIGDLDKRS